jgi:hypothetical protein
MTPQFLWDDPVVIEAARTCDYLFELYKADGTPQSLNVASVARFKLSLKANSSTPLLDIDSVGALTGGSIITVVSLGSGSVPAQVQVRFHQNDTKALTPREDYFGELGIVDASDGNVFKRAGFGLVALKPSPGGNVGLTH